MVFLNVHQYINANIKVKTAGGYWLLTVAAGELFVSCWWLDKAVGGQRWFMVFGCRNGGSHIS